jgi:hypothetical protein
MYAHAHEVPNFDGARRNGTRIAKIKKQITLQKKISNAP